MVPSFLCVPLWVSWARQNVLWQCYWIVLSLGAWTQRSHTRERESKPCVINQISCYKGRKVTPVSPGRKKPVLCCRGWEPYSHCFCIWYMSCVFVFGPICHSQHVAVREQLAGISSLSTVWVPENWTWVFSLRSRCLYPVSYPTSPMWKNKQEKKGEVSTFWQALPRDATSKHSMHNKVSTWGLLGRGRAKEWKASQSRDMSEAREEIGDQRGKTERGVRGKRYKTRERAVLWGTLLKAAHVE